MSPARQDWLAARRRGLGGSDAAVLLGLDPYRTITDLWLDKTGRAPERPDTPAAARGRALEGYVLDEYERRLGVHLTRPGPYAPPVAHPIHEWMLASPDAMAEPADRARWGVDAKTAAGPAAAGYGRDESDEVPPHVHCQCQWYMAVLGCDRWDVAALVATEYALEIRVYSLRRDQAVIDSLIRRGREFWRMSSETGVPPHEALPEWRQQTTPQQRADVARAMYPYDTEPIEWSDRDDDDALVRAYFAALDADASARAALGEATANLEARIGAARGITTAAGTVLWATHKTGRRLKVRERRTT